MFSGFYFATINKSLIRRLRRQKNLMSTKNKELLFLLLILAIAAFFRLWQLNEIPPGLYPDVAMNDNNALETLRTRNIKVFYPENNGREGLMMWLIALSFSVFGDQYLVNENRGRHCRNFNSSWLIFTNQRIAFQMERERFSVCCLARQFFSGDFFLAR